MDILNAVIKEVGGVCKLADELGEDQAIVSNWRRRGLPRPWRLVLVLKYPVIAANLIARAEAAKAEQQECANA